MARLPITLRMRYKYSPLSPFYELKLILYKWATKRMNIKLVLYNSAKNAYKLKNHKEDVGECVMRRQTWSGVHDSVAWRRAEYKLMNKMVWMG